MRTLLTCCFVILVACTTAFAGIRVVNTYTHPPRLSVSVFPAADTQGDRTRSDTLTETICHELTAAGLVSLIPLWEQIDESWVYEPSFIYTEYDNTSFSSPDSVDTAGQLRRIERIRLVPSIKAEWIIDAVYIHDTPYGKLAVDVWDGHGDAPVFTASVKVNAGDSLIQAAEQASQQINRFFFDYIAPSRVLHILNRYDGGTLTADEALRALSELDTRFPDSVFVSAGKMILFHSEKQDESVVMSGKQWFKQRNACQDEQNRLFQALNSNPYLIYGDALLATGSASEALNVYSVGMQTFPFNTSQLEEKYFFYRSLNSKSE
jgi:hypothetical protein